MPVPTRPRFKYFVCLDKKKKKKKISRYSEIFLSFFFFFLQNIKVEVSYRLLPEENPALQI